MSKNLRKLREKQEDDEKEVNPLLWKSNIMKVDLKKHYTFGVVYKATTDVDFPEDDIHKEFATAEELQEAQWQYVKQNDRRIFVQHGLTKDLGFKVAGQWVDICVWPYEVEAELYLPNKPVQKQVIPAGSVFMGVLWVDWAWELVKEGRIRGFSFGGTAQRKIVE